MRLAPLHRRLRQRGALGCGSCSASYGESSIPGRLTAKPPTPISGGAAALGLGFIAVLGLFALAVPVAFSVLFGRKYGLPGYVIGFFTPGFAYAVTRAISGSRKAIA